MAHDRNGYDPNILFLVMDLDQTLISSEIPDKIGKLSKRRQDYLDEKLNSYIMKDSEGNSQYRVFQRPYLQEFFDFMNDNRDKFRLAVWTAASKPYATSIINNYYYNKPHREKLEFIWYDDHVKISETHFNNHKDLDLLWDVYPQYGARDINSVILDDNPRVYGENSGNVGNAIRAPEFFALENDSYKDDFLAHLPQSLLKIREGITG
jgi:hypothetical protein